MLHASAFFTTIDGEVHHQGALRAPAGLIGIGVLPHQDEESERIFAQLVKRNAVNLHSPASQSVVFYSSQDPELIEKECGPCWQIPKRREETKESKAKVKFQNANCKMTVWPLAMVSLPSFYIRQTSSLRDFVVDFVPACPGQERVRK